MNPPLLAIEWMTMFLMVPLAIVAGMIFIPIILILTYHRRKMLEIQMQGLQRSDAAMVERIEGVRQELAALRDTSTQFDVSFDTALHRVESRMMTIEQRLSGVEQRQSSTTVTTGP